MLEYDNSAFYYFAITLLSFYLIPGGWYFLSEVKQAFLAPTNKEVVARTSLEQKKADEFKKKTTGFARLKKWQFILNFILLVLCFMLFVYLISMVYTHGQVTQFDPYQILGIESGVETSVIKKAYRKLSLKYHPDKNPGDKVAEEMFMKIAKAYEALTDETARENYEKFGNPDGKQALELSIGLPTWLLENPKVVLVLYLIGMVVVIPVAVGLWYSNSKQYGEKNIKYETYSLFYQLLGEGTRLKGMPEVFSAATECRDIHDPSLAREEFGKLFGKLKNQKMMQKTKFDHPSILQTNLLLHAHFLQMVDTDLTEEMRKHLNRILSIAPELIDGMIEISSQKRFLQTTISAIKFSQCVIQGLWEKDHSLLQLPHFGENEVKHASRGIKGGSRQLMDYLTLTDEEKKGLGDLSEGQKEDVLIACRDIFPRVKVDYKVFVEDDDDDKESVRSDADEDLSAAAAVDEEEEETEEDKEDKDEDAKEGSSKTGGAASPTKGKSSGSMKKYLSLVNKQAEISGEKVYEGDLVSLKLTLTRENVAEGDIAPPVHAPSFPRPLRETWWVILTETTQASKKNAQTGEPIINLYAVDKISSQEREVTHTLRFPAHPKAGTYTFEVQLLSACYMGMDRTIPISIDVHPADELPEYMPHPEDVELDNEVNVLEQMLVSNLDDDSSEDESSDDEDDVPAKGNKKKGAVVASKKVKAKKAGAASESESESESDEEE